MKEPKPKLDWSGTVWKCNDCDVYIGDDEQVINGPLGEHTAECKANSMTLVRRRSGPLSSPNW